MIWSLKARNAACWAAADVAVDKLGIRGSYPPGVKGDNDFVAADAVANALPMKGSVEKNELIIK